MTTGLLTTAEAAARMSRTHNNFVATARKNWGLLPVAKHGNTSMFDATDVDAAIEKCAATPRQSKKRTKEQANEKMMRDLHASDSKRLEHENLTMTSGEEATVYAAFLNGTLGPHSPYLHAEPPARYRLAYEARKKRKTTKKVKREAVMGMTFTTQLKGREAA